ncbi:hypothetical protein Lal_00037696 [Lupinus albus]|nr:hypothetical protein Lal_00037696 [Lupinus albus]
MELRGALLSFWLRMLEGYFYPPIIYVVLKLFFLGTIPQITTTTEASNIKDAYTFVPGSLYAICKAHHDGDAFMDGVRGVKHVVYCSLREIE